MQSDESHLTVMTATCPPAFCTPLAHPFAEEDSPQLTPRSILISPQSTRSLDVVGIRKAVSFEDSPSIVVIAPRPSYNPAEGPCLPMSAREFRLRNAMAAAKAAEAANAQAATSAVSTSEPLPDAASPIKQHHGIIKRSCMLVRALSAPLVVFARVSQYSTTGCSMAMDLSTTL